MTKTFSQFGRLTVGKGAILSFTVPVSSLRIEDSALNLSCFLRRWIVAKKSILRLIKHRYFSDGLRIEHDDKSNPRYIVFWTIRFDELKRELEKRTSSASLFNSACLAEPVKNPVLVSTSS